MEFLRRVLPAAAIGFGLVATAAWIDLLSFGVFQVAALTRSSTDQGALRFV
jgi:hypothetical protein